MKLLCGIIFFVLVQNLDAFGPQNLSFNEQLTELAKEIIKKYFTKNQCIVIIKDNGVLTNFTYNFNNSFMLIESDLCYDDISQDVVVQAFNENCNGFIVQTSNPECVMKLWTWGLFKTIQRPNPKLFYLPVVNDNDATNISEVVFSMRESEITEKILVAEYTQDPDWPISLYTNNFVVPVGTPGKELGYVVDRWSYEKGFENNSDLYPDKSKNLHGKTLRVMTFDYLPYTKWDPPDGFEVTLIKEFCLVYNCTLEYIDDGYFWGNIYDNGTGNGLGGLIYTDKADFGVAANYLWADQFFHTDFSHTYLSAAMTLLVPRPVPLSGWRVPFLPFDLHMWILFGLSILIASILMYIITAATIKYTRFADAVKLKRQFTTLDDSFLKILGMSVLQQPSTPLIPNTPIRYLFTSLEILYLIFTTCYSAELSSFLTVPQYTKPIDSFHELAEQNFPWAAVHEAYTFALRNNEDADAKIVVKNFHRLDMETLIKVAKTGKYGLPLERCPAGHYTEHEYITEDVVERSHIMAGTLFWSHLVAVVRKASPYKEKLDRLIAKLLDGGMFIIWEEKVAEKYLSTRIQQGVEHSRSIKGKNSPTTLSIEHVQGTFIIYGCGLLISTGVFLYEYFRRKDIKIN